MGIDSGIRTTNPLVDEVQWALALRRIEQRFNCEGPPFGTWSRRQAGGFELPTSVHGNVRCVRSVPDYSVQQELIRDPRLTNSEVPSILASRIIGVSPELAKSLQDKEIQDFNQDPASDTGTRRYSWYSSGPRCLSFTLDGRHIGLSLPLCGRHFEYVGGTVTGGGNYISPVLEEIQLVLEKFFPKEIKEDYDGYIRGDPEPYDRYGRKKKNVKVSVFSSAPRKYVPPEVSEEFYRALSQGSQPWEAVHECYGCKKSNVAIFPCKGCDVARYCGENCMKKHWPKHELFCTSRNFKSTKTDVKSSQETKEEELKKREEELKKRKEELKKREEELEKLKQGFKCPISGCACEFRTEAEFSEHFLATSTASDGRLKDNAHGRYKGQVGIAVGQPCKLSPRTLAAQRVAQREQDKAQRAKTAKKIKMPAEGTYLRVFCDGSYIDLNHFLVEPYDPDDHIIPQPPKFECKCENKECPGLQLSSKVPPISTVKRKVTPAPKVPKGTPQNKPANVTLSEWQHRIQPPAEESRYSGQEEAIREICGPKAWVKGTQIYALGGVGKLSEDSTTLRVSCSIAAKAKKARETVSVALLEDGTWGSAACSCARVRNKGKCEHVAAMLIACIKKKRVQRPAPAPAPAPAPENPAPVGFSAPTPTPTPTPSQPSSASSSRAVPFNLRQSPALALPTQQNNNTLSGPFELMDGAHTLDRKSLKRGAEQCEAVGQDSDSLAATPPCGGGGGAGGNTSKSCAVPQHDAAATPPTAKKRAKVASEPATPNSSASARGSSQATNAAVMLTPVKAKGPTLTRVYGPNKESFVTCDCGCGTSAPASSFYHGLTKCPKGGPAQSFLDRFLVVPVEPVAKKRKR